jgi:hypothetical protein
MPFLALSIPPPPPATTASAVAVLAARPAGPWAFPLTLQAGDAVEVRDTVGKFVVATILQQDGDRMYIKYHGFSDKWNEWVNVRDEFERFANLGTYTQGSTDVYRIGDWVQVVVPKPNTHSGQASAGYIIKKHERQFMVEYTVPGHSKPFQHWFPWDSPHMFLL